MDFKELFDQNDAELNHEIAYAFLDVAAIFAIAHAGLNMSPEEFEGTLELAISRLKDNMVSEEAIAQLTDRLTFVLDHIKMEAAADGQDS